MKSKLTILGVDVGMERFGLAVVTESGKYWADTYVTKSRLNFRDVLVEKVKEAEPDLIVIGKPNRFYNVIVKQSELIGIVNLVAEDFQIQTELLNDSTARAKVFAGSGSRKKEEIQRIAAAKFPNILDDGLDALVLAYSRYLDSKK